VLLGKPNVYGSIFRFEGQASVFSTADGPCYRCLFPEPPPPGLVPNCAEGGVLGALAGMIGTIQATEALKLVLGIGQSLAGRLLLVDALTMEHRTVTLRRDPACPACGTRTITELIDYDEFCGTSVAAAERPADAIAEITPRELAARLIEGADLELIDVREPGEWEIAHLEGARLVPLATLGESLSTLDRTRETIVMCRSGVRSARAAAELQAAGFAKVRNLAGGLLRWSDEVDPTFPRY
jgi:adenylyltransferase/sulfurtransferase